MKNVRARNGVVLGFCVLSIVAFATASACSSRQGQSPDARGDIRTERAALAGAQPDQSTVPASENRLTAGTGFNCMILATGALKCWGDNHDFQLGIGPGGNRGDEPGEMGSMLPAVSLGTGVTARSVAAGTSEACALLSDSTIKCWGRNIFGALGIDAPPFGSQPGPMGDPLPRVPLGRKVRSLVAGADSFFCALLETGEVKCWGRNNFGQLGVGDMTDRGGSTGANSVENTPTVDLGIGRTATSLAAGVDHACAILENGDVKCWGSNQGISGGGQLGTGDAYNRGDIRADPHHQMGDALPIVPLGTGLKAVALVAGRAHTCARLNNGSVKCWGENESGQLGIGTAPTGSTVLGDGLLPVNFGAGRSARSLVAGPDHTCAVLDNGIVKCWGNNGSGQLGIESTSNQGDAPATIGDPDPTTGNPGMRPVSLGTLRTARALAAGGTHTCAWLDDGSVKCWGGNGSGESGVGLAAVQYGKAPGTMGDKLMAVPLRQSLASSSIAYHNCAVLDDGKVKCWGYNSDGQLGLGHTQQWGSTYGQMGTALNPVPLGGAALAVATGRAHSCALLADHSVKCWGANEHGQLGQNNTIPVGNAPFISILPIVFPVGRTVTAIAAGGDTSCAVLDDASLACWGSSNNYQLGNSATAPALTPIPVTTGVKGVSVSAVHVCAVLDNQKVKCWGQNQYGQLGIGNATIYQKTVPANPISLPASDSVVQVTAGSAHTCVLLATGAVKCWGRNTYGQLGLDNTTGQLSPTNPISGEFAVAVVGAASHTCALLRTGAVRCWGYNGYGQTGPFPATMGGNLGDEPNEMEAQIGISLGTAASAVGVFAGGNSTCALLSDGRVKCWGYNVYGELGQGYRNANNAIGYVASEMGDALPATQLGIDRPALSVAAGDFFSCAILENGPVKCWGKNESGQLGLGDTNPRGILPTQLGSSLLATLLGSGRSARMLAAGGNHACALLDNGNVKCWGANASGQLGLGNKNNRGVAPDQMNDNLPIVPLGTGRTAVAITAGTAHSCALLDDNTVKCWGANAQGQLGLGTTDARGDDANELGDAPRSTVALGFSARAIAADRNHTCALLDNGTVKCWGENANGELGVGGPGNRGDLDGELGESLPVVDLGTTTPGSNPPGPLHTPILVAPSCAVLENGQLKCWGDNTIGQLGLGNSDPHGLAPEQLGDNLHVIDLGVGRTVLGLAARNRHKCAILDDSSIKCWGDNGSGQLGLGVPNNKGASLADMGDNLLRVDLGTPRTAQRVTVGATHTCAVLDNGTIKCWGYNAEGELGIGTTTPHGSGAGQMGGNLPIVSTGDTDPWNGGKPIVTGCAPETITTDGNTCTTDGCDPAAGVTHAPVCNDACRCNPGRPTCNDDCENGLVCGTANGPAFNQAPSDRVCWPPYCAADPDGIGCSSIPHRCTSNSDCPAATVCGLANGSRFGLEQAANVCWPASCTIDPAIAGCGTVHSPCGLCQCVPQCAGRQCGDPGNGCGKSCPGLCANGQAGCTSDPDCPPGSRCLNGMGSDFGQTPTAGICLPGSCLSADPSSLDCGHAGASCGSSCPTCATQCGNRICGDDPAACSAECGTGSCNFGALTSSTAGCTDNGQCILLLSPLPDIEPGTIGPGVNVFDPFPATSGAPVPLTGPLAEPTATSPVGAVPGSFAVTKRGTPEYSIPILVMPNRNQLQPQLALKYIGGGADSFLGTGWALSGFSKITRCARTVAQDGISWPILLSPDDVFCLDGNRLISSNGRNGEDGTVHTTEVDSFQRITPHGGNSFIGPSYWRVETPEGLTITYGDGTGTVTAKPKGPTGGTQNREWLITSVEDRSGNLMEFEYKSLGVPALCRTESHVANVDCSDAEVVPAVITYGQNPSAGLSANLRSVTFTYEETDRPDPRAGYFGGAQIRKTALLKRIEAGGIAPSLDRMGGFHSYNIEYQTARNGMKVVHLINECAISKAGIDTCKAPTTFEYVKDGETLGLGQPQPTAMEVGVGFGGGTQDPEDSLVNTLLLDVNGDGRTDVLDDSAAPIETTGVFAVGLHSYRRLFLSSGRRDEPFLPSIDLETDRPFAERSLPFLCAGPHSILDFNYDGKDDIISSCPGLDEDAQVYIKLFLSNGSGFDVQKIYRPDSNLTINSRLLVADLDGDSRKDLIQLSCADNHCTHASYSLGLPDGSGFSSQSIQLPDFGTYGVVDLDNFTQIGPKLAPSTLIFDIDGDGSQNILTYDAQSKEWRALVLNTLPTQPTWNPTGLGISDLVSDPHRGGRNRSFLRLLDVNGDGLTDVLEFDDSYAKLWINKGGTFEKARLPVPDSLETEEFAQSMVFDYDADGRDDLLIPFDPDDGQGRRLFSLKLDPAIPDRVLIPVTPTISASLSSDLRPLSADVDGDGNRDLIRPERTPLVFTQFPHAQVLFGTGRDEGRLNAIVDGLGYRTELSYASSDEAYQAGSSCSATSQCVKRANGLVGRSAESFFGVPRGQTIYRYGDARTGTEGRGWLGFAQVLEELSDPAGNMVHRRAEEYDNQTFLRTSGTYLYPFVGRPKAIVEMSGTIQDGLGTASPNARTATTAVVWKVHTSTQSGRPFVVEDLRETLRGDQFEPFWDISESSTYDDYGNVTRHDRHVTDVMLDQSIESETLIREFDSLDPADWFIRSPSRVTRDATRGDETRTNVERLEYGEKRRLHSVVSEPGDAEHEMSTTLDDYDAYGNPQSVTRSGKVTSLTGQVTNNRTVVTTYDGLGIFPISMTGPLPGHIVQFRFDERFGAVSRMVDPNGLTENIAYDGFGRVSTHNSPTVQEEIAYDRSEPVAPSYGLVRVSKQRLGASTMVATYDPAGQLVEREQTGFGGDVFSQEMLYDWRGEMLSFSRPHKDGDTNQGIVTRVYDTLGRPQFNLYPNGYSISYRYSTRRLEHEAFPELFGAPGANEVRESVDSDGVRRVDVTGHRGETLASVDGAGADSSTMTYLYGPQGALRAATDQSGSGMVMHRDPAGFLRSQTDPDTGGHEYHYNGFGELEFALDSEGRSIERVHDLLGRVRSELTFTNTGSAEVYNFDYDVDAEGTVPNAIGHLIRSSAQVGAQVVATDYRYDRDRGLVSDIIQQSGDVTLRQEMTWDYLGRMKTMAYPDSGGSGFSLTYTYEPGGEDLTKIEQTGVQGPGLVWQLMDSDFGFRPKTWKFGNGAQTNVHYEPATGRIDDISTALGDGSLLRHLSYSYNLGGSLLSRTDSRLPRTETFSYDSLNRMKTIGAIAGGVPTTDDTFVYEFSGNVHSSTSLGTYAYGGTGGGPHAVAGVSGTTYHYDAVGKVTSRDGDLVPFGEQIYHYDAHDQLTTILAGGDQRTIDYTYDALGHKVARELWHEGDTSPRETTTFLGDLYSVATGTGGASVHRYRVYANGVEVADALRNVNAAGETTSEQLRYMHSDLLGSPVEITTTAGALEHRAFTPFGELEPGSSSLSATEPGFTGHRHEDELGLIDMRGRFFDPRSRQFLSADPLVQSPFFSQAHNGYSYVMNSPMNFVDPTGYAYEDSGIEVTVPGSRPYNGNMGEDWSASSPATWLVAYMQENSPVDLTPLGVLYSSGVTAERPAPTPTGGGAAPDNGDGVEGQGQGQGSADRFGGPGGMGQGLSHGMDKGFLGENNAGGTSSSGDARTGQHGASGNGQSSGYGFPDGPAAQAMEAWMLYVAGQSAVGAVIEFLFLAAEEHQLGAAREARDELARELAAKKGKPPATVTGGYNKKTGEVAARACGGGKCAETHVVEALGGEKGDVGLTEAVRPRTGAEVPICPTCEATYGRGAFPPGTKFKSE